jgi:serine protease Do
MLMPDLSVAPPRATQSAPLPTTRGWLGLALQPITVPDVLVAQTGQTSARMVVSITRGGPAEKAGLQVGDVLLALNGTGATGAHALRAFLASERIGSSIEVKLLRDGAMLTTHLTVAAQPAEDHPLEHFQADWRRFSS